MLGRCCTVASSKPQNSEANEVIKRSSFQTLNGLHHLIQTHHFKAWFLDQFGVLHDGKQPYPGAISTCMFPFVTWSHFNMYISKMICQLKVCSHVLFHVSSPCSSRKVG
ncbi:hypothetical protein Leryth_023928 [Lithospermum erythrorhizon]|nr:hypothetical protein Leryth_023928 [Lithospermum erythrorhizon]